MKTLFGLIRFACTVLAVYLSYDLFIDLKDVVGTDWAVLIAVWGFVVFFAEPQVIHAIEESRHEEIVTAIKDSNGRIEPTMNDF